MTLFNKFIAYFKEYYLIYIGVILCTSGSFTFYKILQLTHQGTITESILLFVYFLLSFFVPIILSIIFTIGCFKQKEKTKLLIEIIHAYAGVILIFAALYFQSIVLSDRINSYLNDKINSVLLLSNEADILSLQQERRAFKGIEKRLWSSFDYPSTEQIRLLASDSLKWKIHQLNNFESVSTDEMKQLMNLTNSSSPYYLNDNISAVYLDCIYFSLVCVTTVGFGDISPNIWYTKLFVMLEIAIGMSIFIFAIGFLFSDFKIK